MLNKKQKQTPIPNLFKPKNGNFGLLKRYWSRFVDITKSRQTKQPLWPY